MKIGLALPGGGSKGAWTAGALSSMLKTRPDFDLKIIYGTSTGALSSLLVTLYAITKDISYLDKLVSVYCTVTNKDIIKPRYGFLYKLFQEYGSLLGSMIFGGTHIYDTEPLERVIDRTVSEADWELLIGAAQAPDEDAIEMGFCSVSLQTGESQIFSTKTHPDRDILKRALLASSNQPVLMPPVTIEDQQWVDGGLVDYTPIEHIFKSDLFSQIDTIVSFTLDDKHNQVFHRYKSIMRILERTIGLLAYHVGVEDLKAAMLWNFIVNAKLHMGDKWEEFVATMPEDIQEIALRAEGKRYLKIFMFRPSHSIKMDSLEFKQPAMKNLVDRGKFDARIVLDELSSGEGKTDV